jgi:dUTP pyrophosphatase
MELLQEYLNYQAAVNLRLYQGELLVKLENTTDEVFTPTKKYQSDAGYDCRARLEEPVTIMPHGRKKIPLGFGINVPMHHTGDLRPRSGLTDQYGIMVGYGTIDAGYTGEVKATIFNFGEEPFTIHPKDRIAQLVVLPTIQSNKRDGFVNIRLVDHLVELERGDKGHGSTGVK